MEGVGRMVIGIQISRAAQVTHGGRRLAGTESVAALLKVLANLEAGATGKKD